MKNLTKLSSLLALLILGLTACLPVSGSIGLVTEEPALTPTQVVGREAHVQSVEIQFMKISPVQVNAIVRGYLTEACATLADTQISSSNHTFMIKLMTSSPSDRGCAQVTTPFEQAIPLDTNGLPDGEYTVKVNGVSAVFTLPAGPSQTVVPAPTIDPSQLKTYKSTLYGYQVNYPADWFVQVNTSIPTDAGKDPEYVTWTTGDPSHLPQIDVWVLTGEPPMSGYEKCEKNFVFRNLPACHLSLPAGQNPAGELWIFQNGPANFYIRLIYQDKSSLQLFDDFLRSFEFIQ